jgi:hypothetical protein
VVASPLQSIEVPEIGSEAACPLIPRDTVFPQKLHHVEVPPPCGVRTRE